MLADWDIITITAIHLEPKAETESRKVDMPPMAVPAPFAPPQMMDPQPTVGNHTIGPDVSITLGSYGRVYVNGLTVEECRDAIEFHLSRYFENPKVAVDILSYNSKAYYVVHQSATGDERIVKFPCTGEETVMIALGNFGGFPPNMSIRAWVERPVRNSSRPVIMPVDWAGLMVHGKLDTNYDLLPGDRVYVTAERSSPSLENRRSTPQRSRLFPRTRIASGERVVTPTIR